MYRDRVGWGLHELIRRSLPPTAEGDGALIGSIAQAFQEEYKREPALDTRAYPGMEGLLDELDGVSVPYAVLSNKPHELTVGAVRATLGLDRFVAVTGAREGIPRKPDPTAALQLIETMGIDAADTAFVGDSEIDIQTALAAGCRAIGVAWGFRTTEQIQGAGAERVCRDIGELRDALGIAERVSG